MEIAAEVEPSGRDGVIVAQGASGHGYSLYLDQGHLALAIRRSSELTVIRSQDPLPAGRSHVAGVIGADGRLALRVNDKPVAEGKAGGGIESQPADGLTVGRDGNGAVGEYVSPNPFKGRVEQARVTVQ